MRWFKHFSDASDDDFIESLEEKFGLEGYARWWKILEIISKAMDKNPCDPSASHPMKKWCQLLKAKPKILLTFLAHSENLGRICWEQNENIIIIKVPKLLKLRDEYSRKSGYSPDKLPAKSTELDTELDIDKKDKKESSIVAREKNGNDFSRIYDYGAQLFPKLASAATHEIKKWLDAGCDVELDIIPSLDKVRGRNIGSWTFFSGAIMDSKISREAPLPEGFAHSKKSTQKKQPLSNVVTL